MRAKYRRWWLKQHARYEKRAYRFIKSAISKDIKGIPWDNMKEWNYEIVIQSNLSVSNLNKAYIRTYQSIGLEHGKYIGRIINKEVKFFEVGSFVDLFNQGLMQWITSNLGSQIRTVKDTLAEQIITLLKQQMESGLSLSEAVTEIRNLVGRSNFYRWQAMRIARTEATRAANYGASVAGKSSGLVLDKEWITVLDARTRMRPQDIYDHRVMNGVKVPINGLFQVQGDIMEFPGDPKAAPGNTINCRCTVATIPRRDERGRLVFNFI